MICFCYLWMNPIAQNNSKIDVFPTLQMGKLMQREDK